MSIGKNIKEDCKFIFKSLINHKPKCLYIGYTGYGNLGDEALREAIYDLFKNKLNFSQSRGLLIRLFERFGIIKFNILMLGGGTLVMRSQDVLNRISDKRINKKMIFGTGVANLNFWKDFPGKYGDRSAWLSALNNISYISVRGPVSLKTLSDTGFKKDVKVIGDPVLYFTRPLKSPKSKQKKLGVNIGTTGGGKTKDLLWGRNEDAFFQKFLEFVVRMDKEGWAIEFLPVNKEDEEIINFWLKKYHLTEKIPVFKGYFDTQKTIDYLETFDVFIGQKLHAVVLAFCANTPSIMVEYRPKCRDFMISIDMEGFTLRSDEFNQDIAKEKVDYIYANIDLIRNKANENCLIYKNKLIQATNEVENIVLSK